MKLKIVALSGFLLVACGGSDRSAQTPSSASTTSAASETDATTSRSNATVAHTPSSTMSSDRPAMTGTSNTGSTGTGTRSDTSVGSANTTNNAATPAPATPAPAMPVVGGNNPTVTNNPGVADQTKNADNTKINDRDRHGALTPGDNGGSKGELQNTAAIRRAVVADKSLSITAKNVKIIVTGTKVTLRGTVKSDQEKAAIEGHAKSAPNGITEVDNQLEVKK